MESSTKASSTRRRRSSAGLLGQLTLDHLADLLQLRLRDPHEKAVLAGKIVVKSGLGDLGAFRYVVHGGLLVPFGR